MKTALIPPIPHLGQFATGGIHLLLSHLVKAYPEYERHYSERATAGDYLILDNSAHEFGVGNGMAELMAQARALGAEEVVVPDVLFDWRATVESAKAAVSWLNSTPGKKAWELAGRPRLMYVPQGDGRSQWARCLQKLMFAHQDLDGEHGPPVIGISKDYYNLRGSLAGLIDEFVREWYEFERADVHCLGWPTSLWDLADVARDHPWVRSTDSAKPFVYAKAGILLEPGGKVPQYPRRDKRYFDDPLTDNSLEVAVRNAQVFEAAARDELVRPNR